jgi:hypothetical protein
MVEIPAIRWPPKSKMFSPKKGCGSALIGDRKEKLLNVIELANAIKNDPMTKRTDRKKNIST